MIEMSYPPRLPSDLRPRPCHCSPLGAVVVRPCHRPTAQFLLSVSPVLSPVRVLPSQKKRTRNDWYIYTDALIDTLNVRNMYRTTDPYEGFRLFSTRLPLCFNYGVLTYVHLSKITYIFTSKKTAIDVCASQIHICMVWSYTYFIFYPMTKWHTCIPQILTHLRQYVCLHIYQLVSV